MSNCDSLLSLVSYVMRDLCRGIKNGLLCDSRLWLHLLNVTALLSQHVHKVNLQPYTVSAVLHTFFSCLSVEWTSADTLIADSSAFHNAIHSLLVLLDSPFLFTPRFVDSVPLPSLLVGICVFTEHFENQFNQCSDENLQIVLLKRILIRVLSRINSTTLPDSQKTECIREMKLHLDASLQPAIKRELDTCIHVLEPLVSVTSSFGEVLRSANQMLEAPVTTSDLTTTSLLKNQMNEFKQKYLANRQTEVQEEETKVEVKETVVSAIPPLSPQEQEQEERLRQIRERMKQRRNEMSP